MGTSLPSTTRLQELSRIVSSSDKLQRPTRVSNSNPGPRKPKSEMGRADPNAGGQNRQPLSLVVADCAKRWFHETLKEAKAGDTCMQVLVAQMYFNGYGVPIDRFKGYGWVTKATRSRASAWRVVGKQPGYNASDSDTEEVKDATNTVKE